MTDHFLGYYQKRIKQDSEATFFIFLTALSKDTKYPQNVFLKGKSGIGKTWVPSNVLTIFGKKDVWMLGGLSPTALVHGYGELVDENGEKIELSEKPTKEKVKEQLELENQDKHITKHMVRVEYWKQNKKWMEKLKKSYHQIDMHGKLLVFLESPHIDTFNKLRPILSHDEEEISYRFTDKTQKGSLRTSHVVISGWPATIFCTTDKRWMEDLATRSLTITPRTTEEKLRAGCVLVGEDAAFPLGLLSEEEERIKLVLENLQEQMEDLIVVVPYGVQLGQEAPLYRERVMRDLRRVIDYIKLNALLNHLNRPKITGLDKTIVLATYEDFFTVMRYFLYCEETTISGLNAHIVDVFHKAMEPLVQFGYSKLVEKCNEVLPYPYSRSTLYVYVRELSKLGWVDEEPDPDDKRKKIINVIRDKKNLLSYLINEFQTFFTLDLFKAWLKRFLKMSYKKQIFLNEISSDKWDNDVETIFFEHYIPTGKNELEKKEEKYKNLKIPNKASSVEPSLLKVENILIRQNKIIQNLKELTRLTTDFEDKCAICNFEGRMDWQATLHNGTWGLLCDKCGLILEKKLGAVE